jgi:hypothetical protein
LRKAARQTVEDPEKGEAAPIFNPRKKVWGEHFCWDGMRVVGLTATGRATIDALNMNRELMLEIRAEEEFLARHPPP